ncbi:MAG: hypothetical protein J1D77_00870 [Muribaculaceae bacterium]|nr:hypothetical protein [Muribaculaceae bacterium]
MSTTISRFTLIIDGTQSRDFLLELDGEIFKLDNFSLWQALMHPNVLRFTMRKGPREDGNDPNFKTCGEIIGKDISLIIETKNMERLSSMNTDEATTSDITFKGIVTAVNGSRSMSDYTIEVEAKSYDSLLVDNPNCKSFECRSLEDIVGDVVEEYSDLISPQISPRFTDELPYTVQYNENNYLFLQRLARRFGEWIYNDGEHLVFGELPEGETVVLGYPDKDVPSYSVDLKLAHTAFGHVASSYNSFDSNIKEGAEEMERSYNGLADLVYEASRERITKSTLQNLHSGGFSDNDGRETVLNVSTKTQARGEKAGMLLYNGTTYSSRLKIGTKLIIKDNFLKNDRAGDLSDVEQDEILITELTHYFSSDETYYNNFMGIPAACDYPPYADSDVFPVASSCRAKVTDNEDPNNLGRIRVQFDWQAQLDDEMQTPWLRISQPYAGGGKGFSFLPEIGEEVMVDFEGGNAERPFVKGTLFNGVEDPDKKWLPGDNQVKAIRTKNGHTIEIWDKEEGGYIRIYDNEKENYILTFSTDDKLIKLESSGNIELHAKKDIIMRAGNDFNVKAGNDIITGAGRNREDTTGSDKTSTVGRNHSESIGQNHFHTVGANHDVKVTNNEQLTANNIRQEAKKDLDQYSTKHVAKASDSMALNASAEIDIKAAQVKTN